VRHQQATAPSMQARYPGPQSADGAGGRRVPGNENPRLRVVIANSCGAATVSPGPIRSGTRPASIDPASIDPVSINPVSINPASINPASINPACGRSSSARHLPGPAGISCHLIDEILRRAPDPASGGHCPPLPTPDAPAHARTQGNRARGTPRIHNLPPDWRNCAPHVTMGWPKLESPDDAARKRDTIRRTNPQRRKVGAKEGRSEGRSEGERETEPWDRA